MLKITAFFAILCTLATSLAKAVPTEGLEAFSQSDGQGKAGYLYAQVGYVKPSWTGDYETIQSYASLGTPAGNYYTFGASLTAGNAFADRDVYFLRYDQTFSGQSISLKFAHEDLWYLQAGKNIFSLDYNASFNIAESASVYLSGGVYYRFNLNNWNTPTWNPLNWNTDDRDSFIEICLGSKIKVADNMSFTVDLNNRDPFLPYNGDDLAIDFTFNFASTDKLTWRLIESNRISGLLVGTGDLSELTILAGFITSL